MIVKARFVARVGAPVIENGAVEVRDGLIAAVGPAKELSGRPTIDYGDAIICPGFVNAHTHLELTHLAGQLPPTPDFIGWLRRLYQRSIADPPTRESIRSIVQAGVAQSLHAGVTTIGDITRNPAWVRPVLRDSPLRAVSFGEVIAIGHRRLLLTQRLDAAASREHESDRLTVGISPHAPYSVEPDGLRVCAERSQGAGGHGPPYPVCVHVAETPEEEEFTRTRSGPFADYLKELGVWCDEEIPISGCSPVELLNHCGLLSPRTVLAHANYLSNDDLHLIVKSGASVAYCPRTHAAFGHRPHRFHDMLSAGINVAVGTDSLASNPSLSILDELRFLHETSPEIPPENLLAMGTLHGARALGLESRVGSLRTGKVADFVVIPVQQRTADGFRAALELSLAPCAAYVDGRSAL